MSASSILLVGKRDSFDEEREALRQAFLKREGLLREPLIPLPPDASKRRYFRLPQALLMDAPPPYEDTKSFHFIAELLKDVGLTVPLIYATDHTNGFLLIEDLGDFPYRKALQAGMCEKLLYEETLKSLIHLHQNMSRNKNHLPLYNVDLFLREAEIFIEWYDLSLSREAKVDFIKAWREAYENAPSVPYSLVMRDVMVENLLWLPLRQGMKRCGFIDFQDAVWGPITYDLVSLLEDARRDIAPSFAQDLLQIYFNAFPSLSPEDFGKSYALWGAQRCTKILGIFSRLSKRDGKPQYLVHLPRVWKILKGNLRCPSLKSIQKWFEMHGRKNG